MFSGIGGFELGIEKAAEGNGGSGIAPKLYSKGIKNSRNNKNKLSSTTIRGDNTCIGFSEIDKYAVQIYQRHFKEHKNYGNCRNIIPDQLPDFDLLVGGFPCQSFSIAGKRGGFEDTRGTLFFEIARIVKVKRPKLLLLENVKGLLSHDKGRTFGTIHATLSDLGYICEWQVLNSKNFGVPQNRERVFIIGHLGGISRRAVFPIGETIKSNFTMEKSTKSISPSITARGAGEYYSGMILLKTKQQNGIRRLTPTECERLQGFPDGWTKGLSDSQRYKCLGNAVTVNVIQAIVERIMEGHL